MDFILLMRYFENLLDEYHKQAVMVYYEKVEESFHVQYRFYEGEREVRLFQADEFLAFSSYYMDMIKDDHEVIHYDTITFS